MKIDSDEREQGLRDENLAALLCWKEGDRMFHICIIEDDRAAREELKILLERALYQVTIIDIGEHMASEVLNEKPDLLLLDLHLPQKDGFTVCAEIRRESDLPIIFLTANTQPMAELNGMLKGGDDYIRKPYVGAILLARIAAVMKRSTGAGREPETRFSCRGTLLDMGAGTVSFHGRSVDLTKTELKILYFLFRNQGAIVSRADLIEFLWDNQIFVEDNALSVNITRIRNKLEQIGATDLIETKRGLGYKV